MINSIAELFGEYIPVQSVVSSSAITGELVYENCTNWSYVFGGIVFCICIYSIFRLIGVLLGGGK